MEPTTSKPFPILDLPPELHLLIADVSPPSTVMNLRLVNKHFNTLIPALSREQLLEAETSDLSIRKNLYACSVCLRLRRRRKFADDMIQGHRERLGEDRGYRLCIDCGCNPILGKPYYRDGDAITIKGSVRFVVAGTRHPRRPKFGRR
ncbi:hypothetical protein ASPSYDRAFT_36390 [Aspergillus sydowii CBS 593.65]|uniref:F-box domain-containing protein n=1 Tax=Aspergillus sydowii CBS 593.65 TaxID=1036612 RepID=A0A1L9T1X5_9EURO|nr:uncharacterized protein ASPSYDRAFT_36390 [Aspergillus sydowii CBS 593.65]OJJ53452.1 hypothetical protein ASPSYDRAFT_36390 [Aspergillus sydowii CBS 593.65]